MAATDSTSQPANRLRQPLLGLSWGWLGLTIAELLRPRPHAEPDGPEVIGSKLQGAHPALFRRNIARCFVLPALLPGIRRWRTRASTSAAALTMPAGLWLDRFLFSVSALGTPRLAAPAVYFPTGVEILITAGSISGFVLICLVFTGFFPMISSWATKRRA